MSSFWTATVWQDVSVERIVQYWTLALSINRYWFSRQPYSQILSTEEVWNVSQNSSEPHVTQVVLDLNKYFTILLWRKKNLGKVTYWFYSDVRVMRFPWQWIVSITVFLSLLLHWKCRLSQRCICANYFIVIIARAVSTIVSRAILKSRNDSGKSIRLARGNITWKSLHCLRCRGKLTGTRK